MPKIAFVGAGSLGFTRGLVIDMMSWPDLAESTISLIDVNEKRLHYAERAVNRIMEVGKYPAKVQATTDRKQGLEDADIVITTILAHGVDGFRPEIEIPMKYGVDFNCRRQLRHRRHLPRAAHHPHDARHLPGHGEGTPPKPSCSTTPTP